MARRAAAPRCCPWRRIPQSRFARRNAYKKTSHRPMLERVAYSSGKKREFVYRAALSDPDGCWSNLRNHGPSNALRLVRRRCACRITRTTGFQPVATQPEFKRIAVKYMSHPVDVVARVVTLIPHVATTESTNIIERDQAKFLRKKFTAEFYGSSNDGLLA